MTDTLTLTPAAGGRVRKPDGSLLAAGGEPIVLDSYWRRRILQEDVVVSGDGSADETATIATLPAAPGDQA